MSAKAQKAALKKLAQQKKKMAAEEKKMKKEQMKNRSGARGKGGTNGPIIGQNIGTPFNFSHDTHVGWDATRGFELRNIPPEWMKLFKNAGATDEELEDPETRAVLMEAMQDSMAQQGIAPPPAPPPPAAPSAPPPPPMVVPTAPSAPPPPAAPSIPQDPFQPGAFVKAIWSEDGQWYDAQIESVREEDGAKICLVTFTEYGNQEEVYTENMIAEEPAVPEAPPEPKSMAALLAEKAGNLKSTEARELTQKEEESIVGSVQKALAARRAGLCESVYGHDAVADEENSEWVDGDDSWMDF